MLYSVSILLSISINLMFNDVFSRDNLPEIKDRAHAINRDGKRSKRTHWVSLFIDRNTDAYLMFLGLNMFLKKYLKKSNKIYDL